MSKFYWTKAYTTFQFLLAVVIITFCIVITSQYQTLLIRRIQKDKTSYTLQIIKLQQLLAQATIKKVNKKSIVLKYHHKDVEIILDRKRIVQTPGYHILVNNIEGEFILEKECIYVDEQKIYCEKGLH